MAELYDQTKIYAKVPSAQPKEGVDSELEALLAELPPEERDAARQHITAAPTGEDIYRAMQEKNANGEVFNMSLEQYRLYKSHIKNKETDIIDTMGQAAGGVFDEIMKAGGSIYKDPMDALAKVTPSLIEAFSQGTRNLYGMAAQSQDPNSAFFRVKNALSANGDDEAAEFQQFMDAQAFNVHSMRLASGQDTLVMDKDIINPEMTQVMSYIADPTLFVPFGGIAAKGARLVGMGEGLAKASARAAQIQRKILGGTLKWGVGAPIEFLGTATRNTIDFGLEKAGSAFETVTGMSAAEAKTSLNLYGQYSVSAAIEGRNVALPIAGDIAGAMVGSTTAKGVGESISMIGEQMLKQQKHGRGVLSYAGQALRDAEKSGVPLSKHARALLGVIDKADPLFVYSADLAKGAGEGMFIGGFLGGLSGGEEGLASGAGAGLALGTVGAGLGSVVSDIGNGRLYDRIAVQRQMVIEGLRQVDPAKASAFEALVAAVETTGNRDYIAQTDGIIAGIDLAAPNAKFNIRDTASHIEWLRSQKIDPNTGRLMEPSAILPEFGGDRKARGKVLSFLGMANERFKSKDELLGFLKTVPQDHALRREFFRLDDKQKQVVFDTLGKHQDAEYRKQFGNKSAGEFYKDLNYGEANVARVNAMFDSGNKTRANEMIRQMLKDETVNGQLTERGKLLKEKLATEGYFDKDGNLRPSRLKDVELTAEAYANSAGFVIRRDSTGQVEININLDAFGKDTVPHELFHAIMMESAFKPDFTDRLAQNLLGKFDANGKMIERPSVDTAQVKKFFARYIDALHGRNPIERDNEIKRLDAAIKEYESRGTTNKIAEAGNNTLETMVEEFGAYYFGKFINDKPVDFLFRGGELGAMREMLGNAKQGWLDFWRSKIKGQNPTLDFDNIQGTMITTGFGKNGVRARVTALDLFMRDFVMATAMANRNGAFDISRLSPEAQRTFIKNQGIRVYGNPDANGRIGRKTQRQILSEQIITGKEIYKILSGLDPELRKGLTIDGEGNLSGRLSPEAMEAIVQSGKIDRAWVDKIQNAYNILDGKGSNIIYFGYLGRTAQIGDYAWPRLVGNAVPFKNRAAVLLDVDFKVGKDGKMSALFHTLDKAVIDGRADVLWSDSAIRQLWDNDRAAMDADFFRYLSNASKASSDKTRVESSILLEDGTGKGAMRRNVLHQILGMVKPEGDIYLNKPIAEIPYGIRHSVTTFSVDGISNMRVGSEGRWDIVPQNAFKDLARNFQPAEMAREETPNGSIIKHPLGYKFTERNGKVQAFDDNGNRIGIYDDIYKASEAAKSNSVKQKQELIKSANEQTKEQFNQGRKFQVLERDQRGMAVRDGDVFEVPQVKAFTAGVKNIIRQSRDEYVIDRADKEIVAGSTAFYEKLFKSSINDTVNYLQAKNEVKSVETLIKDKEKAVKQLLGSTTRENGKIDEILNQVDGLRAEIQSLYFELQRKQDALYLDNLKTDKVQLIENFLFNDMGNDWEQQVLSGVMPQPKPKTIDSINQMARKFIEDYRKDGRTGLSEVISSIYSDEYNQQFQTGQGFVTVAVHGTSNIDLMVSREFKREKLGEKHRIFSSQNGVFFAGQETTSRAYTDLGNPLGTKLQDSLSKNSQDYVNIRSEFLDKLKMTVTSLLNTLYSDGLSPSYKEYLDYRKKIIDWNEVEPSLAAWEKVKHDYRLLGGNVVTRGEIKNYIEDIVKFNLKMDEEKDLFGTSVYDAIEKAKDGVGKKAEIIDKLAIRLINKSQKESVATVFENFQLRFEDYDSGANIAANFGDAYRLLHKTAKDAFGESAARYVLPSPDALNHNSNYYEGLRNSIDANKSRIIAETRRVPMELRALVKMENPFVVEGRKNYDEYHLKDIMEPAMKAGHDGVIFRNMRDGGAYDNIYVVFKDYMDSNIMTIDTSFDDVKMPRGKDSEGNPIRYGRELGLRNQPTERDAGGRVYDQNSDEFKSGFIGLWASKNPEKLKGKNIEFFQKADGSYRIRMQDNSSGKTKNVGHITASISDTTATLSSNIDPEFRGNKLSYALYSEMAERLRAMGVEMVDGQIVNKDGVPIKVREQVIGDTRDYFSGKPISQAEGARRIQERQAQVGSMGGVDVYNRLDKNARYQPAEGKIESIHEDNFNIDLSKAESEALKIAKDSGINILRGKTLSQVYIDKTDIVRGGLWTEIDGNKFSFDIVVDKNSRKKGIGSMLIKEALIEFNSLNEDGSLVLDIDVTSNEMKRLLEKNGFVVKGKENGHTFMTKPRYQPREEVVKRAKEAGYKPTIYYHGTPRQFTEFKSNVDRTMNGREGATAGYFFFTPHMDEAKGIHGSEAKGSTNVMQVFLKYDNPFNTSSGKTPKFNEQQRKIIKDFYRANANYSGNRDFLMDVMDGYLDRRNLPESFKYLTREKRAELLKSLGYDSLIDKGDHIVVFDPEQIKSADDFTYDDQGREIPLEERFNKNKKDIRYQPAEGTRYEGGDDYWKPKKNIFERKDEQGFLIRRQFVGNDEITGDKNARGGKTNPELIGWEEIGHYSGETAYETGMTHQQAEKWEANNMGLWYFKEDKGIKLRNPMDFDDPSYTHGTWFDQIERDGKEIPQIWGRYERPIYDKNGNVTRRGRISITSQYRGQIDGWSKAKSIKESLVKSLKVGSVDDYDAYMFDASDSMKNDRGYSSQDTLPIKFQPAEGEKGGRTYTDEQFNKEFIGKYASENPELADKFIIRIKTNDGEGYEDYDYKMVIYDKETKKPVARTKWQLFENEDGILEDAAADVEILNNAYKGMKLSHLMQSERLERSRFLGAEKVRSQITNEEGIPIKNYAKTIGADKGEITSAFSDRVDEQGMTGYVPATMENFKQEMDLSKQHADNTWKPAVYYRAKLDTKAHYQPAEQRNVNYSSNDERVKYLMSIIDNVPHYKKAFDSGQLSIDAYKPEEFKDFDVLSHAPDTASTVEQKNFKAQGGVGYPLLFPEEGWAAVSRGLEKRLNAIGEMNLKKHGKWIAPMAMVLSHAQKMQGARNGTEGFINIIKQLEDKKVINNETLRAALVKGLQSIGTEIKDDARIGDAMFATYKMLENSTSSGFKKRAKFISNVAGSIARNTGNLSNKQIKALKETIPTYTGNKTITKKELIPTIFQMFADPLVQGLDAPDPKTGGDVYAFVLFDKPLVESESSPHSSYKYSVRQEDNSPVRVDLLSRPMKTLEMFKQKRTSKGVSELKEKTVVNDTGQRNFPYGRVIHAQPAEGFRDWKAEQTTAGSLIKNSAGFVISRIGSKYRVYNPYKAVIGVFDNEEQAKRRVQREEPKR